MSLWAGTYMDKTHISKVQIITNIEFRVSYLCIFSKTWQGENSVSRKRCNILPKPSGLMLASPGKYPYNEVWMVCFPGQQLGQHCPLLRLWPAASPSSRAAVGAVKPSSRGWSVVFRTSTKCPWCFAFYNVDPKYLFFSFLYRRPHLVAAPLSCFCGSHPLQHSYSFDIIASEDFKSCLGSPWDIFPGYCLCSMQPNPLVCSKLSGSFLHSHEQTPLITLFPDCKARGWALPYCLLSCF